eukprot:GHVN01102089.1.p1 GENE.GHVN01102089.1~~GHVN01102089.1.p1  ORF type:complete len:309 (+),score=27.82 GHVN01102089.1:52-978(+)
MIPPPRKLRRTRQSSEDEPMFQTGKRDQIEKQFQKIEVLGEGTYGVVYKARHLPTGRIVALKKIRWENTEEGVPAVNTREICLLKELTHPNIVKLHSVHIDPADDETGGSTRMFLEFEFVEFDLRKYAKLFPERRIPMHTVKDIMYQILVATTHCHTHRALHRDLKPCNILLSVKPRGDAGDFGSPPKCKETQKSDQKVEGGDASFVQVKLADFGLSRTYSVPLKPLTHEVVTLWYRAPEILLGMDRYSTAVDIFSIGVILMELLQGRPPFAGDCEIETLFKMFELLGTPTEADWGVLPQLPHFQVHR